MSQWKTALSLALFCAPLTACSNHAFLNAMNFGITTQDQQNYLKLSAEVDLGNVNLDQIQIPVLDPRTHAELGQIGFQTASSGKQQIFLALNASSILHADAGIGMNLPNGRPLPGALNALPSEMFGLPVLNHSRVYIGGDLKSHIILGLALTLPALDPVTGRIPIAANAFFSQTFNPQLMGSAGLYTSPDPGQSGVAVFARFTPSQGLNLNALKIAQMRVKASTPRDQGNQIQEISLNGDQNQQILKFLYGKKRIMTPD